MTDGAVGSVSDNRMRLRYTGVCRLCGIEIPARTEAIYERATRTVRCVTCTPSVGDGAGPATDAASPQNVAGASARRQYERRRAKDEQRTRERWGKLGGVAVALSNERQSTKAWDQGAVGEEKLGSRLDSMASDAIAVLHDRRIPGSRANIDHIAVTRSAIWVIDAKRYKGRPELKVEGGILRPRVETLMVGRRDRTNVVDGVLRQRGLVKAVAGDVPVIAALCIIDADWPLIGGSFAIRGVEVLWPRRLVKLLTEEGGGRVDIAATCSTISAHFPPA